MMTIQKCLSLYSILLIWCACEQDGNLTKIQYMPDMADTPTVKPYREYLDPPEGSIAIDAVFYPESPEQAETLLENPLIKTSRSASDLDEGKTLFREFCSVCHGNEGKGDGTVVHKYPRPPDITVGRYLDYKDGYFFHIITFGHDIMPSYGHAISVEERWQIVLHLRSLQEKGSHESN